MNKILRISLVALLTLVSAFSFASEVTFDATKDKFGGKDPAKITGTKDGVTFELSNGVMSNGREYRFYKGETLTLSVASGNITKIVFTSTIDKPTEKYGVGNFTAEAGSYSAEGNTGTWTGSANTVKLTAKSNQVRATKIVVTIEAGTGTSKKSADLAFSKTSFSLDKNDINTFEAPTFTKATTAAVTFTTTGHGVATVSEDGVISLTGAVGKDTIKAASLENDDYYAGSASVAINVYSSNTYKKATAFKDGGKYIMGFPIEGTDSVFYAYPISASKSYGYLMGTKVEAKDGKLKVRSDYDDTFTFKADEQGDEGDYNIVQPDGRMLFLKGTYASFNVDKAPTSGHVWTVSFDATTGEATIQNKTNSKYITGTIYNGTYEFKVDAKLSTKPVLYVLDDVSTKIDGVQTRKTVANDAIYNLAGQRVSKTYKGMVIKNGKKYIAR